MIDHATLVSVMSSYGMWVLTPLAVVEGPIVTVIAGYLASRSILSLWQVIPCVTGDGRLRTVEEIHREVWSLVSPLLNLN